MSVEMMHAYINDIAKRLHDPNQFGSTSVMIGAGFSKNAVSLVEKLVSPNWEELAKKIYEALYPCPDSKNEIDKWEKSMVKKTAGKNVLKLAEEYKVAFGRNKLDCFIEKSIEDDKYIPGNLHVKLLELNWNDIFTTNYDTLLERAINNISVRKSYKILLSQNDLPGSTRPRIIKLHGSIPNAKPYIFCEEDYRTYPVKYAPFVNTVQQSMLETQLCLIGFSGDDPNFLNWLGWLRDNMGENCPQIYLCGIFRDMSESEKRMLQSQNISILNLEYLIDDDSVNRHYDAINIFLGLLKNYGKKRNIYKEIKYKCKHFSSIIGKKYYDEMINYTEEVKAEISKYIALPLTETENFYKDLYRHFQYVLRDENNLDKVILSSNIVFLLRKFHMPLMDGEANHIEKLIEEFSFERLPKDTELNNYKSMWFELVIYLAEMYRVDSRLDKYHKVIKLIESHISCMNAQKKSEYHIEQCKYHISAFDYCQAFESTKKIGADISFELQIKKACLLSQLRMGDAALELLKKCSTSLAQKSYSEDKTASLISYINLCARSISLQGNSLDDFSDKDFADNNYNLRKVFTEHKDTLINSLFAVDYRQRDEVQGFNPNSYTYTYGTTPTEVTDAFTNAFRYLLFQDNLCLPVFSDHKQLIKRACTEIIESSENPLWKWSYIIRTDDDKIIKSFFTRERIVSASAEGATRLFDQLILLLDDLLQKDHNERFKKIITLKTIYEILSRLCVVLDDDRIMIFLNKIYGTIPKGNLFSNNDINNALTKISYFFNSNILMKNIDKVLKESSSNNILLAGFFQDIIIENLKDQVDENLILNILEEVKSENINIRDNGLAKVILLNQNNVLFKQQQQVATAIWSQIDGLGFPKSNIYPIITWDELPHNSKVSFSKLYTSYLKTPQFPRCVEGATIHGYVHVDVTIHSYLNCFYYLSDLKDNNSAQIDWNNEILNTILGYIFDYLQNEKKLINCSFDMFGESKQAKRRFSKLSELVAYVFTQAVICDCYDGVVQNWILKLKDVFQETNTSILSIDILEKLLSTNWNGAYKNIVKQIMAGSWEYTSQAFTSLDIILVYKEFINDDIEIEEELQELIKSLKYMSIKNSCSILLHLTSIIKRKLFLTDRFRNVIIKAFHECLDIYEIAINEINKDYLDALFNLSNLVKEYYNQLIKHQIKVPEELSLLIDRLKKSPLNEVKNTWQR